MPNTSRRNFGKLIAGAAAALPLASGTGLSAVSQNTSPGSQDTKQRQNVQPGKQKIFSHQNTPPPMILEEGSLKVDLQNVNLGTGDEPPGSSSTGYRWDPGLASEIYIIGLRIVSGSGEELFYLDRDDVDPGEKQNQLHVLIDMEGSSGTRKEVIISTNGQNVTFKVPGSRKLKKKLISGTPEPGNGGRVRFRYYDDTGSSEPGVMKSIAVAIGPSASARVITRLNGDPQMPSRPLAEARVMVWFGSTT